MNTFIRLKKYVDDGLTFWLGFLMFSMAIIVFLQVVARYVFNQAFSWPEEVVRAGVVWTTFLGSYAAVVKNKEIKFDVLVHKFTEKVGLALGIVGEALTSVFLIVVVYQGWLFVNKFASYKLPMTGWSRAVVYIVFPLGGLLMLIQSVLFLMQRIKKFIELQKGQTVSKRR